MNLPIFWIFIRRRQYLAMLILTTKQKKWVLIPQKNQNPTKHTG